jgi:plasmid stabilization system protein ParE
LLRHLKSEKSGKREMTTVWPYIVRYRVDGERVIILRIRHGREKTTIE